MQGCREPRAIVQCYSSKFIIMPVQVAHLSINLLQALVWIGGGFSYRLDIVTRPTGWELMSRPPSRRLGASQRQAARVSSVLAPNRRAFRTFLDGKWRPVPRSSRVPLSHLASTLSATQTIAFSSEVDATGCCGRYKQGKDTVMSIFVAEPTQRRCAGDACIVLTRSFGRATGNVDQG